ncbi:hypothetical protein KEM55_000831 [Ascosphaera atra]|nr:hypothetical protein KEM55_000831 [Ascosphaera atra]
MTLERQEKELNPRLEDAAIKRLPPGSYYIPNFVNPEEEEYLLRKITNAPLPRWTTLTHRRLQTWPSALSKSNTLLSAPLPDWLVNPIIPRFGELGIFEGSPHGQPNHVLINEYQPGQGIMPHEDGPAYYPIVATVSLGAEIVLDVRRKKGFDSNAIKGDEVADGADGEKTGHFRILQEPRSLLITTGEVYTDFLHGVAEVTSDERLGPETVCNWELLGNKDAYAGGRYDRKTRTSLTYRDVLKVSKVGDRLRLFGKK